MQCGGKIIALQGKGCWMIVPESLHLHKREFSSCNGKVFNKGFLVGLTVAAFAITLALVFGVDSNADSAAGLVTAILAGIVIGIFPGMPYQVSGPTGRLLEET